MTPEKATAAYRKMVAAWPSPAQSDDTARLWLAELGRCRLAVAQIVVDRMIRTYDRFPSLAQWHEACRATIRRLDPVVVPALPASDEIPSPERHASHIAAARAALAQGEKA